MTSQFTAQLPKIEERVQNKQRLTLKQGALLLQQYRDLETANELLQRRVRDLEFESGSHAYFATLRTDEWNELVRMLGRVLGAQVYSDERDGDTSLWTAEWQGKKSKRHRSVAAAYEAALKDILGERSDSERISP